MTWARVVVIWTQSPQLSLEVKLVTWHRISLCIKCPCIYLHEWTHVYLEVFKWLISKQDQKSLFVLVLLWSFVFIQPYKLTVFHTLDHPVQIFPSIISQIPRILMKRSTWKKEDIFMLVRMSLEYFLKVYVIIKTPIYFILVCSGLVPNTMLFRL